MGIVGVFPFVRVTFTKFSLRVAFSGPEGDAQDREIERSDDPDYEGGIVTREFLRQLAEYIDGDEELDIQTTRYTKYRFPVLATRYGIRDGEVLHADLSGLDPIDE